MPENAGELVAPSLRADPAAIGALRLDLASDDLLPRCRTRSSPHRGEVPGVGLASAGREQFGEYLAELGEVAARAQ
jgi:hypothetical protein